MDLARVLVRRQALATEVRQRLRVGRRTRADHDERDDILPGGVVVIRGERGTSGERKRGQNGGGCCTDERGTPAVAESHGLSAPGGGHSLSSW